MVNFQVGDLVKKVRGPLYNGHQGWVKEVFISQAGVIGDPTKKVGIFVTGIPDRGVTSEGQRYRGYDATLFEKVTPVGVDRERKILRLTHQSSDDRGVA